MTANDKHLKVSLDSVHEKNVRHGHVSTPHIWSTRMPLAASYLGDLPEGTLATIRNKPV